MPEIGNFHEVAPGWARVWDGRAWLDVRSEYRLGYDDALGKARSAVERLAGKPGAHPEHYLHALEGLREETRMAGKSLTEAEIENRFTYHPPLDDAVRQAHDHVRAITKAFARELNDVLPPGREASLALTSLENAAQWCHAAIARNHQHYG